MRVDEVYLVGLGGVGSILLEPLARLMASHAQAQRARLTLCDGDAYEASNASRQLVPSNNAITDANKARASKQKLDALALSLTTRAAPVYMSRDMMIDSMAGDRGHVMFVLCVDNNATHKAALDACEASHARDVTILRPGNGAGDRWGLCTVSCYAVRAGKAITCDPRRTHAEVGSPDDYIPGEEPSCAQKLASQPQRLTSNMMAAAWALCYVSAVLDDRAWPDEHLCELGDAHGLARDAWRASPAGPMIGDKP